MKVHIESGARHEAVRDQVGQLHNRKREREYCTQRTTGNAFLIEERGQRSNESASLFPLLSEKSFNNR